MPESELYFTQLSHWKQMGLYSAAFRPEHTYIIRERTVHGCARQHWKRSCRDAEGPCYVLAHQDAWAALVSFGTALGSQDGSSGACRRVSPPGWQPWALHEGFPLRTAALGLAWQFPPPAWQLWGLHEGFLQDGSSGACKRIFPACCSMQWGRCSSTRTSPGVLTQHWITPCSFIFLF